MKFWFINWTNQVTMAVKLKINKTGVINDPLGQTHSHASSEHCFLFSVFVDLKSGDVRTYGRTDNMCENNYPYRPWLWVGRVDQQDRSHQWSHQSHQLWSLFSLKFCFVLRDSKILSKQIYFSTRQFVNDPFGRPYSRFQWRFACFVRFWKVGTNLCTDVQTDEQHAWI